jgi:hypothetical protein
MIMKKLGPSEFERFIVEFSNLKSYTLPILLLVFAFFSVVILISTENDVLEWFAGISFIFFLTYFRMNAHSHSATETAFASKNSGLVLWSHKDQLNFMDRVYEHDDIEEFLINDGFLKKKVSILFKDGSKEDLSSYFLIFKYE